MDFFGPMSSYNVRLVLLIELRKKIVEKNEKRRQRRLWVREILLKRVDLGEFRLFMEMHDRDEEIFFR